MVTKCAEGLILRPTNIPTTYLTTLLIQQRENNIQAICGINIISNLLKEPNTQNDLNRLYSIIALTRSSLLGTIISRSMTN